ncbi:amidohydrolase [Microbacterium sp.]|uniref:amidohydrolase n=1 Tax=Microbacterium sp. TaxID=51671 RepID=UPI003A87FEA4
MHADMVFTGGPVYTVDDGFTVARALATTGNTITAVGTEDEIAGLIGPDTTVIPLEGRCLLPGIDDSHLHAAAYGISTPPMSLDLTHPTVTSIADITAAVAAATAERPAGTWIVGQGWDTGYLQECLDGDRSMPDKGDLDAVSPDHPVLLVDFSGHLALANSVALALGSVDATTVPPPGGVIDVDDAGEITGILREAAQALVGGAVPPLTREVREAGIRNAISSLHRLGITAYTEPGLGPGGAGLLRGSLETPALEVYEGLLARGELDIRVSVLLLPLAFGESAEALTERVESLRATHPVTDPRRLNVIGVKLFADGVPPNETAYMYAPYGHAHGHGALSSFGETEPEQQQELLTSIKKVHDLGLQAGVHVTGDHGIDLVVRGFAEANEANPREDSRHYVIHGDFASPESLTTLGAHGWGINMNPGIKAQISDLMDTVVGEDLSARQWPTRSALDAGALLCASSDAPITPPLWLNSMAGMMARTSKATGKVSGAEERVSFADALRAHTINGATQSFAELWRGSLETGKVADLVVLDADLGSLAPEQLPGTAVVMTVVDGKVVYRAA